MTSIRASSSGSGRLKCVLFDLDGTLVDSESHAVEALLSAATQHGHKLSREAILRRPGAHFAQLLVDELDISPNAADAVCLTYDEIFLNVAVPKVEGLGGANELIAALANAGVQMAIVTNKPSGLGEAVLANLDWARHFPVVVAHGMAPENKPSPMPALMALGQFGLSVGDAVFVGDTEGDMICGRAAGLRAVVAVEGTRPREVLLMAGATHVCAALPDVGELLGSWLG